MLVNIESIKQEIIERMKSSDSLVPPEKLEDWFDKNSILPAFILALYDRDLEKAIDRKIQEALSKRLD